MGNLCFGWCKDRICCYRHQRIEFFHSNFPRRNKKVFWKFTLDNNRLLYRYKTRWMRVLWFTESYFQIDFNWYLKTTTQLSINEIHITIISKEAINLVVRNSRVRKSSSKIELCKMTSHLEFLTRDQTNRNQDFFIFRISDLKRNFLFFNFKLVTQSGNFYLSTLSS